MAQPRPRRMPRRLVRYKLVGDALGPYITFSMDVVVLPGNIPPYALPPDTRLEWSRLACRFTPGGNLTPRQLEQLFEEFADTMHWEAQRDP